jgi:hypothetical protein
MEQSRTVKRARELYRLSQQAFIEIDGGSHWSLHATAPILASSDAPVDSTEPWLASRFSAPACSVQGNFREQNEPQLRAGAGHAEHPQHTTRDSGPAQSRVEHHHPDDRAGDSRSRPWLRVKIAPMASATPSSPRSCRQRCEGPDLGSGVGGADPDRHQWAGQQELRTGPIGRRAQARARQPVSLRRAGQQRLVAVQQRASNETGGSYDNGLIQPFLTGLCGLDALTGATRPRPGFCARARNLRLSGYTHGKSDAG